MIKEMRYNFHHGEALNFRKEQHIPLQSFMSKRKPTNYYDLTRKRLGYVIPSTQSELESDKFLPSYSSDSSDWESYVSVGVVFKTLFANMTSISQVDQDKDMEPWSHSKLIRWLTNLIFNG